MKRNGAWVEHKKLLVAWHYRLVEKDMKLTLMAKAKEIYAKHNFDVLSVSKWFGDNSTRIHHAGLNYNKFLGWTG